MTNQGWQRLSQLLGVLLVVLVGAAAVVVLTRSGSTPSASPGSSQIAVASASPSGRPSRSPAGSHSSSPGATASAGPSRSAEPSPSPEASASPSAEPSQSPSVEPSASASAPPSQSPSASPSVGPTAPTVSIRFRKLGFDGQGASTPTARTISFRSEGPGDVSVHMARTAGGDVRLCLGPKDGAQTCLESDKIDLTNTTLATGRTSWVVTAVGTGPASPIADLRIVFRTTKPGVTIDGFRLQGTSNDGFNGIEADLQAGTGTVRVEGHWDGSSRPWRAQLTDADSGETLADITGSGNDLLLDTSVTPRRVHLSLTNTENFADQEVFLHAVIRWP